MVERDVGAMTPSEPDGLLVQGPRGVRKPRAHRQRGRAAPSRQQSPDARPAADADPAAPLVVALAGSLAAAALKAWPRWVVGENMAMTTEGSR